MLTDAGVRAAKPKERDYKLNDSGGLVLFVTKAGSELWRLRYLYQGKEKLFSLARTPKRAWQTPAISATLPRPSCATGKNPAL